MLAAKLASQRWLTGVDPAAQTHSARLKMQAFWSDRLPACLPGLPSASHSRVRRYCSAACTSRCAPGTAASRAGTCSRAYRMPAEAQRAVSRCSGSGSAGTLSADTCCRGVTVGQSSTTGLPLANQPPTHQSCRGLPPGMAWHARSRRARWRSLGCQRQTCGLRQSTAEQGRTGGRRQTGRQAHPSGRVRHPGRGKHQGQAATSRRAGWGMLLGCADAQPGYGLHSAPWAPQEQRM